MNRSYIAYSVVGWVNEIVADGLFDRREWWTGRNRSYNQFSRIFRYVLNLTVLEPKGNRFTADDP
ncbi:MAG: hypothetical protein N2C14_18725 [Planctomycetales bacterium]